MYIFDLNRMMFFLSIVWSIYYRGSLEYCNYMCLYCLFGRKFVFVDMIEDQEVLDCFIFCIGGWKYGLLCILIIFYGEVMIYCYYREGIMCLVVMFYVIGVFCQINLFFLVFCFLDEVEVEQVDVFKFRFWVSYYLEMVGVGEFVFKVEMFCVVGIGVCVGVVGDFLVKE